MNRSGVRLPFPGELDRQVEIQYKSVTPDATYGTEIVAWLPLVATPLWAQILDALPSRSESVLQGLAVAKNQSRIRMRWRDDVESSMRIVDLFTDDVYEIIGGPAMLGRRQYLELQCERRGSLVVEGVLLLGDGSEFELGDGSSLAIA